MPSVPVYDLQIHPREGELIARLESFDYEAQLARSRAQVESVRAQVGTYDARVTRANADLSEFQRQWRMADRLATEQVGSVDARDAARWEACSRCGQRQICSKAGP